MSIINNFKDNVACDFDKINVNILKNIASYIINTYIYILIKFTTWRISRYTKNSINQTST